MPPSTAILYIDTYCISWIPVMAVGVVVMGRCENVDVMLDFFSDLCVIVLAFEITQSQTHSHWGRWRWLIADAAVPMVM